MKELLALIQRQDLVLTRAQALSAGITKHAWDWSLTTRWRTVVAGVAVCHTGALTDRQRVWAALLNGGAGARLSGDALLKLLGCPLRLERIDVAIPHDRRVRDVSLGDGTSVTYHRVTGLAELHETYLELPIVSRHTAVLHAAAWAASDRAAEWRLASAVQRRITAPPNLRTALEQLPRLPRRALLREVLDDVELGAHAASELAFLRFLRRHHLPRPDELQVKVRARGGTAYLDARYRKQRVSFEIDGAHHREAGTWDADALRSLRVAVAEPGEQLIRLTRANLRHDAAEVATLLRALLLP